MTTLPSAIRSTAASLPGAATPPRFQPGIPGFSWADLHDPVRLAALTAAFDDRVAEDDPALFAAYAAHRAGSARLAGPAESDLLVRLAAHVSRFLGRLFGVEEELAALRGAAGRDAVLFRVRTAFVQRRVFKKGALGRPGPDALPSLDAEVAPLLAAAARLAPEAAGDPELLAARLVDLLLSAERALAVRFDPARPGALDEGAFAAWRRFAAAAGAPAEGEARPEELARARALLGLCDRWLFALTLHPAGAARARSWTMLKLPQPVDHQRLVPLVVRRAPAGHDELRGHPEHQRRRDGFDLTDPRKDARAVRGDLDYCIYCHEREKDSCSSGFHEKGPDPKAPLTGRRADAGAPYKKNPLGIPLTGCPLEERISEAHRVAAGGDALGALALVCVDNPMAPGTGHRICNDCMKACIYQKQEPVDIPQIETRVLSDVLRLRWGFELWSLLTRWNPLKLGPGERQHPRPYAGVDALVVGLGPAGYTLAHHLLNEGFGVVGVDGLKVEPLPPALLGRAEGQQGVPEPIERLEQRFGTRLDERVTSGFGGVSEYGITVRWDKRFLDVLHLNLARRRHLRAYGGVRFGGTITVEDAWELGFDHVALAAGAGRPTIIPLRNNLVRGVRKASDFLMALQLTGAFKEAALANLQARLPAVVIGGGLTAIDTATELAAWYPRQVEKLLARHEVLAREQGEARVLSVLDAEEREVYREALEHGRAVRAERARAAAAGEAPDLSRLVDGWGGVTICYRKGLTDSPAYRLNHEEVVKALEEGVAFAEGMNPREAVADESGAVRAVRFGRLRLEGGKWVDKGETVEVPARTVCVAAGTSPNVTLGREAPGLFELDPETGAFRSFRAVPAGGGWALEPAEVSDDLSGRPGFFTSYQRDGRFVSYFGDNHPVYAGSVVKAMASAKDGYPHLAALFAARLAAVDAQLGGEGFAAAQAAREARWQRLAARLDDGLSAAVHAVRRLTPTIVEVVVRAPFAARRFRPGQFYRLQNFETLCARVDGTALLMEGLALTGAWVDREQGLLGMIVLEMGGSSNLCAALRPGEPVVVMGPTGAPSTIPQGKDVVLCGGGLGNAVLFSIGRALRENGCRVIYFAGYRKAEDVFKREELEASADVIVWSVDRGTPPEARRPQDRAFTGNIVESMVAYATGALGPPAIPFAAVERVIAIGSDRMMAAVGRARHERLQGLLPPEHQGIASINSPMQCMMKEICAQCLQRHRDPKTGKETIVFTCFDQDQPMDVLDWENLRARLKGNSLQEKIAALWLERALVRGEVPRV